MFHESFTITVNVKATTEFTIDTAQYEVNMHDNHKVEDLVKDALKTREVPNLVRVTRRSDNAVIALDTKLSDFEDGTVLDISK